MCIIRPGQVEDAPTIARIHTDTWRTTYVGIVPEEHLANLKYECSQAHWATQLANPQGETHIYVAEVQPGQVIGFACGGPLREALANFDGELYAIYILKSFQGLGYGKLLVRAVAQDLASRAYRSMVIWVLKDNPACRFYETIGGKLVAEKAVEIGGKRFSELAYSWSDLGIFTKN
jgi:L-amino acid N-acyltransferase YncA